MFRPQQRLRRPRPGSASLSVHGRRFKRQHPRSLQFDAGAAVHGPLEGLQPVDLTFGLSAAPSLGDCIPDGVEVSTQRSRKGSLSSNLKFGPTIRHEACGFDHGFL
jgi:hypothetical protein